MDKKYTYNDVVINGKVVKEGYRSSQERYEQISEFCKQYNRPFSVLDIGAAEGYFTHKLSNEFDGVFTAVEVDENRNLLNTCEKNSNDKVLLLQKRFNLQDLKELAEVQYFDVILALNVIHHFEEPFQEVLDVIMSMCSYCFFEHPDEKEDVKTINFQRLAAEKLDLDKYNAKYLIDTNRWEGINRQLYLLEDKSPKKIVRRYTDGLYYERNEGININSSFNEVNVSYVHREENRPWNLGMNLRTFLKNNGVYPSIDKIFNLIDDLEIDESNEFADLAAHNCILNDGEVILIDQDGDSRYDKEIFSYITEKEKFKVSLLLAFGNVGITEQIGKTFAKGHISSTDGSEGPWLAVISSESGKGRCFTTKSKEHAIRIYELNMNDSKPKE